jgi:hypothetical protein
MTARVLVVEPSQVTFVDAVFAARRGSPDVVVADVDVHVHVGWRAPASAIRDTIAGVRGQEREGACGLRAAFRVVSRPTQREKS